MAYTQQQAHTAATRVTSGSTIAKAYASSNTAGNLLVAAIAVRQGSGTPSVVFVSDTAGNPWRMIAEERSGLRAVALWACDRAVGGANTVTATAAAAVASMQMDLLEYAGATGFELIDSIGAVTGTATPEAATTIDTCAANDLVISVAGSNSTTTSFTKPSTYTADAADATSGDRFAVAHLLSSGASATQTASWTTQSGTAVNVVVIAAFKQIGVAASAPHIRQTAGSGGSGASSALTLQTDTAAGNAIVACVLWFVASGTPNITSVTDTQGLNWQKAGGNHDATNLAGVDIWYANSATAAANTVTANYSPNATGVSLVLIEIAGTNLNLTSRPGTLGTAAHTTTATSHAVSEAVASVVHDIVIALHGGIAASNVARAAGWDQAITRPFNSVAVKLDSTAAINTSTWTTDVAVKSDSVIVGLQATSPLDPVTTTLAPSIQIATAKALSTSVTTTPTLTKTFAKPLAATVALSATLARSVGKGVAASVTTTATFSRAVAKRLSVSTTAAATVTKTVAHVLTAATITTSASLARNVAKALTATAVVLSASLTGARAFFRTLSTSASLTPTLAKNIGKGLTTTAVALTATLRRAVAKGLAVTATTATTMARAVAKPLSTSTSAAASLIAGKGYFRTLAATVTLTPTLVRNVGKGLTASATLTAAAARAVAKGLSATVAAAPSLLKAIPKVLTAPVTPSAVLTAGRSVLRALSTSVSLSASLLAGRTFQRALSASVAVSASLTRAVGKGLEATATTATSIGRAIGKGLSVLVNLVPFLNAQPPGIGIDAFTVGPPFVGWEVELQLSWAMNLTESWVVALEVPGWQPSPPESSWVTEVST